MSRRHWNKTVATNTHAREVRGKHTANPGYKEGDYWAQCQRCGFDVYGSTLVEDGYRKGLLVCPRCKDLPHPQDYVRAPAEKLTPDGPTTGLSDETTVVLNSDEQVSSSDPNITPLGLTSTDEEL
jgi:hypothetical protein